MDPLLLDTDAIARKARRGIATGSLSVWPIIERAAPCTIYQPVATSSIYDPVSDTTFIAYLRGPDRGLRVASINHATGAMQDVFVGAYVTDTDDNHGAPTLALDNDRYLHVCWGSHGKDNVSQPPRYAKSNAPADVSAWTVTQLASPGFIGTYFQMALDEATGDLYMIARAGYQHVADGTHAYPKHEYGLFARLPAGGAASDWAIVCASGIVDMYAYAPSDARKDFYVSDILVANGRVYFTWWVAHGASHDGTRSDVFIAYYDIATGHVCGMDGTDYGTSLTNLSDITACRVAAVAEVSACKLAHNPDTGDFLIFYFAYDSTPDRYVGKAAKWDGSSWTISDTGIRNNYFAQGLAVRVREDGLWEVLGISNTTEAIVNSTATYNLSGLWAAGGDLVSATSPDGETWTLAQTIPAAMFRSRPARIHAVRNGREHLAAVVQGMQLDNENWRDWIYALGRSNVDLLAQPKTIRQTRWHNVVEANNVIINALKPPGTTAPGTIIDLSSRIPEGTEAIRLRVLAVGTGTTMAPASITFMDRDTLDRTSDAQRSFYDTTTQVADLEVPVGPSRRIYWRGSSTTLITFTVSIRAIRF